MSRRTNSAVLRTAMKSFESLRVLAVMCCLVQGINASPQTQERLVAWEPVGLSGGGAMFAPAISPADPDVMMINCDMGAAYISMDGGRNWRMVPHAQLRSDTACRPGFHPTNPDILYASSGGQMRVSHDRGRTFTPRGDLKEPLAGEIAVCPANPDLILVGTRNERCFLSRDAAATWTRCVGPQGRVLGFHFENSGRVMFAATEAGIWRSDDGGRIWVDKTARLPAKPLQGFAAGSSPAGHLTMLYCAVPSRAANGVFQGGIYRSQDGGETWHWAMGAGINKETQKADEWAYGPVAQYHQLLTTDKQPLTVYAFNTSTGFNPPHHETVYRSDDGGDTWRATYYQDPRFSQCNVEPDYVTASCGQSFKGGGTPFGVAICNTDPDRVLLTMNECHVTHNGGQTWFNGSTYPAPGQKRGPGCAWVCNGQVVTTTWNYYIDPFEPNRHYIAYTDLGFARSTDGGHTWIWWDKRSWAPWRNTCYEIAFDPAVPGLIWGAFSDVHDIPNDNIILERHRHNLPGGVCVSRDFGASWKPEAQGLPAKAVTGIVLDPRSPRDTRTLYAGVFDAGVFKSTDSGRTWALKSAGLGDPKDLRVSRVVLHPDGTLFAMVCAKRATGSRAFLSQGVGLYRSCDAAETWQKINGSDLWLYPKDFSVHPRDSRRILVGACDTSWEDRSGGLYLTEDGGEHWRRIGREGPQTFGGYFHPQHESWIYMTLTEDAPGAGLWLSRDNGQTWAPFDDLPFGNVQRVCFDPAHSDRMYVTTFGGSVWRGPVEPHRR